MPTALITGTSTGIGLETAIAFARKGYRVFAGLRSPAKASLIQKAIGEGLPIVMVQLDVDNDDSVEDAVSDVLAHAGSIDVLVNNAGIGKRGAIELLSIKASKAMFETNYFGAIRMMRAVLPGMRARCSGAIVNVTSLCGRVSIPLHGHYTASKYALEAASEALAGEMRPFGVRVAIIEPGVILTPIFTKGESVIDPSTPYLAAINRLSRFFGSQLVDPTMPAAVAGTIIEAVETDAPRLRYLVGEDARALMAGRGGISDETWIELNAEPDEEQFVARALEVFGMDLFNPPSAFSRSLPKRTQASAG